MTELLHVSPGDFLLDTFRLGRKVYETGFRPKHVISIWRGGTPVGLGVDEFFRTRGVFMNHTTIATESYTGIQEQGDVFVKGLEHVIEVICREDGLLIVDDVLESGRTIKRVVEILRERARANAPEDIRVATVHRKPDNVVFHGVPVITLKDLPGHVWIDYPHELADLASSDDPEEALIRQKDPAIWDLLHSKEIPTPQAHSVESPYEVLSAHDLLLDSLRLGLMIARDESYRPDFLVALWPGGINTGLPVHELFKYEAKRNPDVKAPDHISLTTSRTRSSYRSDIVGIQYLVDRVNKDHNVLIVDTTFRSGQLVNDVLMNLKEALRRNLSLDRVRVAAVYYNPEDDSTWTVPRTVERPHYYVKEVRHEVVYPQSVHKLGGGDELKKRNPELHEIVWS